MEPILFLDDHRGIYIPQNFAESIRKECLSGVESDTLDILLSGPDHEFYWDAWSDVTDNAIVTDDNGVKYSVYQDGACWLIPEGMEWSEDDDWFVWQSADDDEPADDERGETAERVHDDDFEGHPI